MSRATPTCFMLWWLLGCGLLAGQSVSVPVFREVARERGLQFQHRHGGTGRKYTVETMGSGGGFFDFDNDGWLDLYLVQSGSHQPDERTGNHLYRNNGDGSFTRVEGSGAEDRGYGMGCSFADYDNDGWTDIYITNFGPNVLLRNRGDGTFEDRTRAAGLDDPGWSASAAFADVNQDGFLDLYVANYVDFRYEDNILCGDLEHPSYCHPDVYQAIPNSLYLNRGDGTFRRANRATGLVPDLPEASKSLGVLFLDIDGDFDLDLYVANDSTANYLFRNTGRGRFQDISLLSGAAYNMDGRTEAGMGVDAADFNLDGRQDLIVTHLSFETNTLYVNEGEGFFRDHTEAAGIGGASRTQVGFGVNLEDFNNDGLVDLFVANGHVVDTIERENPSIRYAQPNQLFLNLRGAGFQDYSSQAGAYFARAGISRGSATGDIDNDGDLDILVVNNGARADLLENRYNRGNWLQVRLVGRHCNRDAVGSLVTVVSGDYRLSREKRSAASYCSQNQPRLHFGLGRRTPVDRLEIRWPCGARQVLENPGTGALHVIEEPNPTAAASDRAPAPGPGPG